MTETADLQSPLRLSGLRRLVLKVGSSLLVEPQQGGVRSVWLAGLAADIRGLRDRGIAVVVVSSGAVALGRRELGLKKGPLRLYEKQAAAAVGQMALMSAWRTALEPLGLRTAQVLLTRDDTENRRRWLNARATLDSLLALGCVPVINENDTVATEEIRYGDNDRLAARSAQMIQADMLVLLSDIDGLYTADPRSDPMARHVPVVAAITPEIEAMAGGANASAGVGTGGMATKVSAARIAAAAGCVTVIGRGERPSPVSALEGGALHTLFLATDSPSRAYKQWLAGSLAPNGDLVVDAGAMDALLDGRSLLPSGLVSVHGTFGKGSTVRVLGPNNQEIALGLAAYDALDMVKLIGCDSRQIETRLGYTSGPAIIHRDDLALTGSGFRPGSLSEPLQT
ncbi:MAG: glutamate 5-kinase [Asticcacaulis sp.]